MWNKQTFFDDFEAAFHSFAEGENLTIYSHAQCILSKRDEKVDMQKELGNKKIKIETALSFLLDVPQDVIASTLAMQQCFLRLDEDCHLVQIEAIRQLTGPLHEHIENMLDAGLCSTEGLTLSTRIDAQDFLAWAQGDVAQEVKQVEKPRGVPPEIVKRYEAAAQKRGKKYLLAILEMAQGLKDSQIKEKHWPTVQDSKRMWDYGVRGYVIAQDLGLPPLDVYLEKSNRVLHLKL